MRNLNKSNLKGALYGFAIGDAMGATTEFMDKADIKAKYGKITDILGGGWLNIKKGNVTDDTAMMLCVAKAYIKYQYQLDDFLDECCKNFVEWLKSKPIDIGSTCLRAISQNQDRKSYLCWMQSAKTTDKLGIPELRSLGNGSLMRCLVPSLMSNTVFSVMQGKLTHNNDECESAISNYTKLLLYSCHDIDNYNVEGISPTGKVTDTLNYCEYNFKTTISFGDSIVKAVNEGGDADTIAALTGGLAGRYYGFEEIPEAWINQLKPKVKKDLDSIVSGLGF